jgi:hypothetical protein
MHNKDMRCKGINKTYSTLIKHSASKASYSDRGLSYSIIRCNRIHCIPLFPQSILALHQSHRQNTIRNGIHTHYHYSVKPWMEPRRIHNADSFHGGVLNFYSASMTSTPQFTLVSILLPPQKTTSARFWFISCSIQIQIIACRFQTLQRALASAEPGTSCAAVMRFQQPRWYSWEMLLRTTMQALCANKK